MITAELRVHPIYNSNRTVILEIRDDNNGKRFSAEHKFYFKDIETCKHLSWAWNLIFEAGYEGDEFTGDLEYHSVVQLKQIKSDLFKVAAVDYLCGVMMSETLFKQLGRLDKELVRNGAREHLKRITELNA